MVGAAKQTIILRPLAWLDSPHLFIYSLPFLVGCTEVATIA